MAGEKLPKLVELMAHLRGPEGCPWDREQSYDSVKGLLLEEAYEVIDAVSARDFTALEDELGDLLFQVVFYACLAKEENRFDIDGVIERVTAKLVRRHPHVFGPFTPGQGRARTPEEALKSWNAVKEQERQAQRAAGDQAQPGAQEKPGAREKSLLDGIAAALPSTLEAHELGLRAAEAGFDWEKTGDLLDKIQEELGELRREIAGGQEDQEGHKGQKGSTSDLRRAEEEAGDLLFAAANLTRKLGSDPESCLRRANQKFRGRFQALEQEARKQGKDLRECTARELDSFWETAKNRSVHLR